MIDELKPFVIDIIPTGSRVICNPPPMDTDEDWVILCTSRNALEREIVSLGYSRTSKKYYRVASSITTYRHETNNLNLIVTDDQDTFDRWREATEIATQENLINKEDRIKLFELITGRNNHRDRINNVYPTVYRHVNTGLIFDSSTWTGASSTAISSTVFSTYSSTF